MGITKLRNVLVTGLIFIVAWLIIWTVQYEPCSDKCKIHNTNIEAKH